MHNTPQDWTMFSLKKKVKPMVFDDVTAGLKGVLYTTFQYGAGSN